MKTEIIGEKTFKPVTLTLTFESQEEVDTLFRLVNCGPIQTLLERHGLHGFDYRLIHRCGVTSGLDSFYDELKGVFC